MTVTLSSNQHTTPIAVTDAERARRYRERKAKARRESDKRQCPVCGSSMSHTRADAFVCSVTCKTRGYRHFQSLNSLAKDPELKRFKDGRKGWFR